VLAAEITDAVLTTAVIDRQSTDLLEVLPRQSGTILCFTRVVGAQGETAVGEIAELENPVGQGADRGSPGSRRVEIQDADGNPLRALSGS